MFAGTCSPCDRFEGGGGRAKIQRKKKKEPCQRRPAVVDGQDHLWSGSPPQQGTLISDFFLKTAGRGEPLTDPGGTPYL